VAALHGKVRWGPSSSVGRGGPAKPASRDTGDPEALHERPSRPATVTGAIAHAFGKFGGIGLWTGLSERSATRLGWGYHRCGSTARSGAS